MERRLLAVSLLLVVVGVALGTGAFTGSDDVGEGVYLAPFDGPNGERYAELEDGELSVDIARLNVDGHSVVDELLVVGYEGHDEHVGPHADVWLEHDAAELTLYRTDTREPIESEEDAVRLGPDESVAIGAEFDTDDAGVILEDVRVRVQVERDDDDDDSGPASPPAGTLTPEPTPEPTEPTPKPTEPTPEPTEPTPEPTEPIATPEEEIVGVNEVPGLRVVDVRLEMESANGIRATSVVTIRNERGTDREVDVQFKLNGEHVDTDVRTIPGEETVEFSHTETLTAVGNYRFSANFGATDENRRLRTADFDVGVVDIHDDDLEEPTCELFGVDLGGFVVCWYWWIVLSALGTGVTTYLVQTRRRGVEPLLSTDPSKRRERVAKALLRLLAVAVGGGVVALIAIVTLRWVGLDGVLLFVSGLAIAVTVGGLLGRRRLPELGDDGGSE